MRWLKKGHYKTTSANSGTNGKSQEEVKFLISYVRARNPCWFNNNNNNNNNQQKKRICKIVDFTVPPDHRIKLKEYEKKRINTSTLRGNLKKLWNMMVAIIPIVIGAFCTVTKGLLKGLEDLEIGRRVETIQTTALLRTARILRRVLETLGDLLSLKLQGKTISWRWCEKLQWR